MERKMGGCWDVEKTNKWKVFMSNQPLGETKNRVRKKKKTQRSQQYWNVIIQLVDELCRWQGKRFYQQHCTQARPQTHAAIDSPLLWSQLFNSGGWGRGRTCMWESGRVFFCFLSFCFFFPRRKTARRAEGDKDSVSGKCTWIASHQLPICWEAAVTGEGLGGAWPAAGGEENNFWCQ